MGARRISKRGNRLTQATDLAVVLGDDDQTTGLGRFAEDRFYSSGLIVGTCNTAAFTRSSARFFAASSARIVMMPEEMIRTSLTAADQLRLAELEFIVVLVQDKGT